MTGEQLAALGVIIAMATGLIGVYFMARQSARETAREHQKAIDDAVKNACKPLKDELAQRTADRDYYRQRADQFEAELRRRGR